MQNNGSGSNGRGRGRGQGGRGRGSGQGNESGRGGGPNWRPGNAGPSRGGSHHQPHPHPQQPQQQSQWRNGPGQAWRPNAAPTAVSQGSQQPFSGSYAAKLQPGGPVGTENARSSGSQSGRGGQSWRPGNAGASRGDQQFGGSGGSHQPQQQRGGPAWGPNAIPATVMGQVSSHVQQHSTAAAASPGPVVPEMKSLKIADGTSGSSTSEELVPIRRPDKGGVKKNRVVRILVNHFPVSFNPQTVIKHYDIDVKPESAGSRPVKMSKTTLSMLKDKLFADHPEFQLDMTSYDGEKNVFSVTTLPTGQFKVQLSDDDGTKSRSFIFSVKLVNELKLCKLKDYLTGKVLQLPREVLQGMDVVMKENPRRHMVSIGRSFHPIDPGSNPRWDLGGGIAASQGLQHSLKPTAQGLAVCLDYSVLAVRKRVSVIQFLEEHIYGFSVDTFLKWRRQVESALKGLKVTVTHRRTKQKYLVSGLTDRGACDISFTAEDPDGKMPSQSVRLLDYFQDKYPEVNIKHKKLPCLNLGKGGRVNYVPMELCVLVEGQRYPKEDLDYNAAALLKQYSLPRPQDRKQNICGMLQDKHGPCGGEVTKNFEIDVRMEMTRVPGRVINPPQLMLKALDGRSMSHVTVDNESCQWNLMRNSVVEGKSLLRWAVLDLSFHERPADRLNDNFIPNLIARCRKLGLHMEKPLLTEKARMSQLGSAESVLQLFERVDYQAKKDGKGKLQLVLCVMTRIDPGYKHIKWVSETKVGIVTQCCLSKMANKGQDQYMANLGMKINAKLGGSNIDLAKPLTLFEDDSYVMVIGADVNHPRASDFSSPSIAAIVASTNRRVATKYISKVSFQSHRSEKIIGFGKLCLELIETYEKINGRKPQRIVIFRDGVSEGQFNMVLCEELLDLKKAMKAIDYFPTVTLIIARKRHQTRLFPEDRRDGGKSGNVPPGTVVDTMIVHPSEFDFYLCSHYGIIGTSKPTHYHVLWDEHYFSSDSLQEFIYNLCFTFARCCKPVSLVTPVYYADLLAYRGRLYYEAHTDGQFSSGASSSSRGTSSSSTSVTSFDESLYTLHSGIENGMFFI